jgi:hypothetical protein
MGGVIEKICRYDFDLRIFCPFDHQTIIRFDYPISQPTGSN